MMKIDRKDRKILVELDQDSRQPFQRIARKVGLSKDAVIYRIRRLQENGVIKQFHTVIDVGKLGFTCYRLYLKLQDAPPKKRAEIVAFLAASRHVTWIVSIDGAYDVGLAIYVRSTAEMGALWDELLARYRDHIGHRHLSIFTQVTAFPRAYLSGQGQNLYEYPFITQSSRVETDDVDERILSLIAADARLPILDIARSLALAAKTVTARIRRLEENGIIIGYRTVFDLDVLGYQYFKVHATLRTATPQRLALLRGYLKTHPNVVYDNQVLGGDDLEIEIQVPALADLRAFIDNLKERFSDIVKDSTHMTYYQEHKLLFFPL